MRSFSTTRLSMHPVTPSNSGVLWAIFNEPGLRAYQDLPDLDRVRFSELVATRPTSLEPGAEGRFEWLIYVKGPPEVAIGWVSVRISDQSRTTGEIGYSIVTRRRGRGYATEAVRALVSECFERAALERVRAYCVPENERSRAVLRNLGFFEEGVLTRGASVRGRMVDVVAYVLPRARWDAMPGTSA